MMHKYFSVFLVLMLLTLGTAFAHEPESDEALEGEVRRLLEIHGFTGESAIDVRSEEGVLTLSGSVSSHEQADSILSIISHLEGVRRVNSNLVVVGQEDPDEAEMETREDTIEMKEEEDEFPVSGEIEEEEGRIQGTVRAGGRDRDGDDEKLAEEVEEKLEELGYVEDSLIEVSVENGVVTVSGSVEDKEEADEMLIEIAKIEGVEEVNANLKVEELDDDVELER